VTVSIILEPSTSLPWLILWKVQYGAWNTMIKCMSVSVAVTVLSLFAIIDNFYIRY